MTTERSTQPAAGWSGTIVRILFGVIWAIDAYLKWLPGFRHNYPATVSSAAHGQPSWLHGWFHFWIGLQSSAPTAWATFAAVIETALALVLLLGVARRVGYALGAIWALGVWAVAEGFGGPYMSGSTDIGAGIIYTMLFLTLLTFAPPARQERLSLDRILVTRLQWWRHVAEPHGIDRARDAPGVEPTSVGGIDSTTRALNKT
jgi:thiosulfate dehydrogenase (quinone) large subunit